MTDYDHTVALIAGQLSAADENLQANDAVAQARAIVEAVIRTEPRPPDPPHDLVTDHLQDAINAAAVGATLWLDCALVEPGPITISKGITLIGAEDVGPQPSTMPMPTLAGGLTVTGTHVTLLGLEIRKTQDATDVVTLTGDTITLASCRILGDPVRGNKRGLAANAPRITLRNCLVDYCFAKGQDSQAVCGWDNTIQLTIEDCWLAAASEVVMIGGSDAQNEARQPAGFTMTGSTLTKRPEWRNAGLAVKNLFELKNCIGARVTGNTLEHCWADGQDGYAIVFTPRNQGGSNPWATVADVLFADNTIRHVCTGMNLLGTDYPNPSGVMHHVEIRDNVFEDVDCVTYGSTRGPGSNKTILLGAGIQQLVIADNHFAPSAHMGYGLYFYSTPCVDVDVVDNAFPNPVKYGTVGGDGVAAGSAAWTRYVTSGTYEGNTP